VKTTLKISLVLNLALLGSLLFLLANQHRRGSSLRPVPSPAEASRQTTAPPVSPAPLNTDSTVFRWDKIVSARDYQTYIANLRAIGCPEATVEDIVRGDTARAFSWERKQLGLNASGDGPWSRAREMQLVASLLDAQRPGGITMPTQNAGSVKTDIAGKVVPSSVAGRGAPTDSPSYPLFLQDANWNALGFSTEEQAVIAQVRQQFQSETADLNPTPGGIVDQNSSVSTSNDTAPGPGSSDAAALTRWHKALQDADQQLRGLMGAQAYNTYQQQQYYAWYQPQVLAAAGDGKGPAINPSAFSVK
jgi:hypothetical protein